MINYIILNMYKVNYVINNNMNEIQKMKRNFRASKAWKDLQRKKKIQQQGYCAVLMTKLTRTANLHHLNLDATKYTDLSNEDNFVYLSNKVHDCVHLLYGSKCGWRNAIGRLIEILEKMDKVNKT